MKRNTKKGLKGTVAFGMALMTAWMPMSDALATDVNESDGVLNEDAVETPVEESIAAPDIKEWKNYTSEYQGKETTVVLNLELNNPADIREKDYQLQYALVSSTTETIADTDWKCYDRGTEDTSDDGKMEEDNTYCVPVSYTGDEAVYVACRYYDGTDYSAIVYSPDAIRFDGNAPVNIQVVVGNQVNEGSDYWMNLENQEDTGIKITAADYESGLQKLIYQIDDGEETTITYDESVAGFVIPYDMNTEGTTLKFRICDWKDNESEVQTFDLSRIKYDFTRPTVDVVFTDMEGNVLSEDALKKSRNYNVKAVISAKDTEVDEGTGEQVSGLSTTQPLVVKDNGAEISYAMENDSYVITFDSDGNHDLEIVAYDNAGNASEVYNKTISFLKDYSGPTMTVSYEDEEGNGLTDAQLEQWQTQNVVISIAAQDVEANPETGEESSGLDTEQPLVVKDNGVEVSYTMVDDVYRITLDTDGSHELEIVAYDNAGNASEAYTKTVKLDKAGISNLQMTVNGSATASDFFDAFTVTATADTISGIKEVDFVFHDNLTGKEESITVPSTDGKSASCVLPTTVFGEEFDGYVQVVCKDNTGRLQTPHQMQSGRRVVRYNKNGAAIVLAANQAWSNQTEPVNVVVIDKITGIQSVVFYVNGKKVKEITELEDASQCVGGISIGDTSPSAEGTEVVVEATSYSGITTSNSIRVFIDKQVPEITLSGITNQETYNSNRTLQITTDENIWNSMQPVTVTATRTIDGTTTEMDLGSYTVEAAKYVAAKTFTEDGTYQVTVTAVDGAGNVGNQTISFTIDKTAPVLSMSGAKEGAYSNTPLTVQFQAIESFFDTNNVTIAVERKLEGTTYNTNVNFVNNGKVSNVSNTFSEDGDYVLTMTAIDKAGNIAAEQKLAFTIDCTAPEISLSGTRDYNVTSQPVGLNVKVIESYYQTNQVQLQGSRQKTDGTTEEITLSGWANTGKLSSLRQEFTEDGYYTITVSATDKAGNAKQNTIHFTIDTEAPVIGDLSHYDGKYLNSFQLKETLEELITELSVPTVKMTLNGEAYDGGEVTADGKYTLILEVEDEVGLKTKKTIEFVIDNTAPKIIFAGVEDKQTYTEAVNLNLSLENENDTIVELLINGVAQELTEGQVAYNLSFDEFGDYEIIVLTQDEAGNENQQTIRFTYAEHKKTAFLWLFVVAIAAAAGLVIFLVTKTKKK